MCHGTRRFDQTRPGCSVRCGSTHSFQRPTIPARHRLARLAHNGRRRIRHGACQVMRVARDVVKNWLLSHQADIVGAMEYVGGMRFEDDAWTRSEGGGGLSRYLEGGAVFERGAVLFSHVQGKQLPPSASASRPQLAGRPWEAMGVSLVIHP